MAISLSLSSSEIFTPSTLAGFDAMTSTRDLHRLHVILVAPVAVERRIEHLAEPVDDDRLLHLIEDAGIDLGVVVGRARRLHQRAARHQDDAAAELFHRGALLLIGADHVVDGDVRAGRKMIGAGAGADQRAGEILGGVEAAPDQLQRVRPVHAHAALRGVHRLGDAEAERPQMPAERDGRVPVDRGVEPRIAVGERIGDHMRRRIGDAIERRRGLWKFLRRPRGVGRDFAAGGGEIQRRHGMTSPPFLSPCMPEERREQCRASGGLHASSRSVETRRGRAPPG